ncbi:MAG: threonine synthase [Myxococcales bacterium]|nr:threonine synthase [Myxococcales bacterium]
MSVSWHLACIDCATTYGGDTLRVRCDCGGVLDVVHAPVSVAGGQLRELFDGRLASKAPIDRSGVWRFRELVLPVAQAHIVTKPEGNTNLYDAPSVAAWVGVGALRLKHEGENPSGSFKDRGMTAGVTMARLHGMRVVACASTGNTSASMAAYAAQASMGAVVFIPDGKIAFGKLSQALAYGAKTIQIRGDFDAAMRLVEEVCDAEGIYLVNSINPFRVEGQKAIGLELMQDLDWNVPDWIVLPGGNLGNSAALWKGLSEAHAAGLIDRVPRIAVVQAAGANPLVRAWTTGAPLEPVAAETLATAIRIGNPVSWKKSLRGVVASGGVVTDVTDQEIVDAKAIVDRAGIAAEPASCATVAGLKKLVSAGVIAPDATVCGVLTGHVLKDPGTVVDYHRGELPGILSTYANPPVVCDADLPSVLAALRG